MSVTVEEWRQVADFPDYAVSSHGRVMRVCAGRRRVTGRPLKPGLSGSGYQQVTLRRDGRSYSGRVNRIVCAAFHGPPPSRRHQAAHNDGDAKNNRADNLRWATPVENEADKRRHGTAAIGDRHWSVTQPEKRARGENHGLAKLTPDAVRAIRLDGRFQRTIAADYGVTQRVIWMIKAGKTWGHVA